MIVDAHCHLTAELPAASLAKVMDRGGVDMAVILAEAVGPVPLSRRGGVVPGTISAFGPDPGPFYGLTLQPLLSRASLLARLGYDRRTRGGLARAGPFLFPIIPNPDNGPLAAALEAYPRRFIAFATVNPNDPGYVDEIDRRLGQGFRGVKVNAWYHRVDLRRSLAAAARRCSEAGYPLLVHLGGRRRDGLAILELADHYPATAFIIAHAGLPFYRTLWRAAAYHPNLYFDLAGPYMSAELAEAIALKVPPGRLLFASGGPIGLRAAGGGYSYAAAKRWVERWSASRVNAEAARAVLGGNLLRLVRLASPKARTTAAAGSPGGRYSSCPDR